ncbi:unnamed protein product [Closterium sp. NIES-54]
MAAQELHWLSYLLTDLGEQPRLPPVPYRDNEAMIALCQEHRLEHRMKHIALRYFLAQDSQQRSQLCLACVATRANTADIFTKALPPALLPVNQRAHFSQVTSAQTLFDAVVRHYSSLSPATRPLQQRRPLLREVQLLVEEASVDACTSAPPSGAIGVDDGSGGGPQRQQHLPETLSLQQHREWHALSSPCLWPPQVPAPAPALACTAVPSLRRGTAARRSSLVFVSSADSQHGPQALYDARVTRYSSLATAALGRLLLPYQFPELSAFATVEDLVSHLRASDARYRTAVPAEFLDRNQPPMFITLYFIVTRLPDSLRSVRDHFLSLDPTSLTVDLLGQHLLAAETSAVAIGSARATPRLTFFEGCSPSPLAPSYASAAAADVYVPEDVGAASASAKRRSSKGKGGRGGGGGSGGGGGGSGSGGGGSSRGGGSGGTVGGSGGWRCVSSSSIGARPRLPISFVSGFYVGRLGVEGECYRCVPPDLGIAAATLGAGGSGTLPGLHLPSFSTNLVSTAALQDTMVTTTTPGGQCVSICMCTQSGHHLATFTRRPGSSLYTMATEPSQIAVSAQVSASGQVDASYSCRLVSHQTLLWHHRLGHPSLPRLCGMHSRLLVSSLPRPLPPLPPSPTPPCLPCVEGRQQATPHSSSFPLTTAPLQTLHMDVWGPACVSGQSRERYFLLVVDNYTRYTTVFPLRSKGEVVDVLIPWIRTVCLQLREQFGQDLPILRLHSDRGGEFSSTLLRDFCRGEGILQSFTLPDSPQQNGIAERLIGLVMEVPRTSMIHAAAPHFLWPFAVWYAAHHLSLWPRVSLPETSPTLRWTGDVGDASVFRVWGSRAFVRDTSADKLFPRAIPCVFIGFVHDAPGWQFYHPTSRRVFPSQDITFDESVPFYRLFPYCSAPPPPPPLFLAPSPPPVDPLPPQGPAPSGVSRSEGAETRGAENGGAEPGGVESGGAEPGGVATGGGERGGAEPKGVELGGAASEGAESGGAEPQGAASSGAGVTGGTATTSPGGARTQGTRAAGTGGVEGPGARGAGAEGAGAVAPGGTLWPRPYFVPLLQQVLSTPPCAALTPPLPCPSPDQSPPPLQPASPLPAPSPSTEQSGGLVERREPASRPVSPVRTAYRVLCSCPPPVPGMHAMTLCPSSVPLRVPLQAPLESSLPEVPDPESDRAHAASPTVSRLLTTAVTDPSFESSAASALVAELLDFAVACRLDYATALVAESASASPPSVGGECALGIDVLEDRQEDFECLAAAVPRFASMLLALEGDPSALDMSTPRSYAEAITGPYSSQWQAAMDAEMASWKSKGTYVDQVPPPGANIVDVMWIFRVKRLPGSPPAFKARYVARGFSQRQGVDYFLTFSPTPKMTTLRFSLPQPTILSTSHSLSAPPSGESVEPSGLYPELVGCLMHQKVHWDAAKRVLRYLCSTSGMGPVLGGRGPVVLTGHTDASWVDDLATQRSSQGYTFSLGSGSVSWRSTRSSSVLSTSCEAEIYAGAMAAQELRWLTYLLTDLGEQPRSPLNLYVDNKSMIALCQEHRLEHRMKHIALQYFLVQELQQHGQLRLAYVATRANTADVFTKALPPGSCSLMCISGRPTPVAAPLEISSDTSGPAEGGYLVSDDTAATRRSPRLETPPGAGSGDAESGGAASGGAASGGAASGGAACSSGGGVVGAPAGGFSLVDRRHSRRGAAGGVGAGGAGGTSVRGAGIGDAGTGGTGGTGTGGTGAEGAGAVGAGDAGTGCTGAGGARAVVAGGAGCAGAGGS